MQKIKLEKLNKIISSFSKAKVLVIGDLILDEYIWGKVDRISPEAPVPVVCVDKETYMPGGASNVANNIISLGGKVSIAGVIGDDHRGEALKYLLKEKGVDTDGVVVDKKRPTTLKTRIIAHHQQVVRIDREKKDEVSPETLERLVSFAMSKIADVDAVIIEDYGKGTITAPLLRKLVKFAKENKKIITVDPKENHFTYYKGVTAITPNHKEASGATGIMIKNEASLKRAGLKMLKNLNCQTALITLGENGMCLFEKSGKINHIPTAAQEVFDVSGAGDTVIACFAVSMASGATALNAAELSNIAAGIVVGKVGAAVTTQKELKERLRTWKR